jgi:hypothetical protein
MAALHPVFVIVAAGTLVCLFARALAHKVSDFAWFSAILNGYKLLPAGLAQPAAYGLAVAEALVVAGLIVPATRPAAAMLGLVLLTVYGAAIAINLLRGNRRIDCGCGGAGQGLSWFLVGRNVLLVGLAVVAAATPLPAMLGMFAWISAICGIAALMLVIAGAEQLNDNWSYLAAADDHSYVLHARHTHDHGEEHH